MRRCHGAAIILTMMQIECVSQFVHALFQQSLPQQSGIRLKTVKLLAQSKCGDDGARPSNLCLPKYILQDGDIKIDVRDRQEPPVAMLYQRLHPLQQFRRMELLSLRMVRRSRIKLEGQNLALNGQT